MFKNLGAIMQQAKQLKESMAQAESVLKETYVMGYSNGDLVSVEMNCKGDFKNVSIDERAQGDVTMLSQLMLEALTDARKKANVQTQAIVKEATGGMDIPAGLLPF